MNIHSEEGKATLAQVKLTMAQDREQRQIEDEEKEDKRLEREQAREMKERERDSLLAAEDPGGGALRRMWASLDDREWRLDNLYTIKDKFGRLIPFIRNDSQLKFWKAMWYLNIILKDRQRGFSTLIAIFIFDYCFWNGHVEAGIIDITLPDARKKLDKIKLAYDHLHPVIQALNPMTERAKESVKFKNGSTIYIGTSHRGGTLEILHVSELGKIAARNPERAREIRTGALNTIAQGNIIIVESTAEGTSGEFHDDCKAAENKLLEGAKMTPLDFKFHFFPWWEGSENELDPDGVRITEEYERYFKEIEDEIKVTLSPRKRAWYVKKAEQQKDDMHREFPSTPDEAFQASMEGAILAKQMRVLRKERRITVVPHDHGYPVNTGWDFGISDKMTIWFHQRVGFQDRVIDYLEGTDDDVVEYWMRIQKLPYNYGRHFLPHDAGSKRIGTATKGDAKPKTLKQILSAAGMRNICVVPRVLRKGTAIQEVKVWLPSVFIDKEKCAVGINHLQNFRVDWDDKLGCWKETPRHDDASHGYDGFETLTRGLGMFGVRLNMEAEMQMRSGSENPKPKRRRASDWRTA